MPRKVVIASLMRLNGQTGVQTHFRTFANWMCDMGLPYHILSPFDKCKILAYPIFAIRRLFSRTFPTLGVFWYRYWHAYFLKISLEAEMRSDSELSVYAQCPLSAHAALRARRSSRQKVYLVVHFNVSQADEWVEKGAISKGGRYYERIRALEEDVLPAVDGVVYVSNFMRLKLEDRVPLLRSVPYRVIPNFVDAPKEGLWHPRPVMCRLINVGTLEPRKNQEYAVRIVSAARDGGVDLHLTLVGSGSDDQKLRALVASLNLQEHVSFLGSMSNAADIIGDYDAYLHVAVMESFGIVLIEAMSRGVPVFAPAVGGVPEVFSDGVEGWFISLSSVDAAASVVINCLEDQSLLIGASHAARRRFTNEFESGVVAQKLYDFLTA